MCLEYILDCEGKTLTNGKQEKLSSFIKETITSNN